LAKFLKKKDIDLVLAPDKGALDRAKQASTIIGCDFDYMEKTRIDGTTVEIKPKNLNVQDKNVAIVDDIISTGGTMAKSIEELKKYGAKKIFVACTHGLFAGGAVKKLVSAGCDEIISTDTIDKAARGMPPRRAYNTDLVVSFSLMLLTRNINVKKYSKRLKES